MWKAKASHPKAGCEKPKTKFDPAKPPSLTPRSFLTEGRRSVRLEPIARNVVGPLSSTGFIHVSRAYGRVDLTDGVQEYMIFRVEKDPADQWSIVEQDGFRMRAFDQVAFEEAFKALLE